MTKREAARLRAKVRAIRAGVVEAIGLLTLGDPVRAKEALAATYERSWSPESQTPDPRIRGHVSQGESAHNQRLRDAGYNPDAMTASEIVAAHSKGLLPALCPGMILSFTGDASVTYDVAGSQGQS